MEGFYTIEETLVFEQTIEKSRFIALAFPVRALPEIELKLAWVKEAYPNARHYVYAYRLLEGHLEKASDDGEPQGTGGRPVLDLMKNRQVWNVLMVVVRYFGGILLGTGGLTRAYGGTARLALDQKPLVLLTPHMRYRLKIPYSMYEAFCYHLRQRVWESANPEFLENVSLEVDIPLAETESFEKWVDEFGAGKIRWQSLGEHLRKPVK